MRLANDYANSRAVLLGSWSYTDPHLKDVEAARNSFFFMQELLQSDLCGWPEKSILSLPNPLRPDGIPDQLVQWLGEAKEVALFYFVGHGIVDEDDELGLCMTNTVTATPRRGTTSLQYSAVRKALRRSHAKVRLSLLDCCYSGIATEPGQSLSSANEFMSNQIRAEGVYTMAASSGYQAAWAESTGTPDRPPLTYFTREVVDVLQRGIPGQPAWLSLNSIYSAVHERLIVNNLPAPTKRSTDFADDHVFARNAAPVQLQYDPMIEIAALRQELEQRTSDLSNERAKSASLDAQLMELLEIYTAPSAEQDHRTNHVQGGNAAGVDAGSPILRIEGPRQPSPGDRHSPICSCSSCLRERATKPTSVESQTTSSLFQATPPKPICSSCGTSLFGPEPCQVCQFIDEGNPNYPREQVPSAAGTSFTSRGVAPRFRDLIARMAIDREFARHVEAHPDMIAKVYQLSPHESEHLRGLADAAISAGPGVLGTYLSKLAQPPG